MNPNYKFNHLGIPTKDRKPEIYVEPCKVYISDFAASDYGVEWLYFEEGSPMPAVIQTMPHLAFEVEDLAKELLGKKVIVEPFPVGDNLTCAFIEDDGLAFELMEYKK